MSGPKNENFYLYLIVFVEIIIVISIILGILTDYFFEIEKEIIIDVSITIMATSAALITFVAVFYVFRLQILTENKRNCGYRKRIFKEKLEDVLGKCKIPDDIQKIKEQWETIKKFFIKKEGKERYEKIFDDAGRRTLHELYQRYDDIMKKFQEVNKRFRWSLWLAILVISSSFLFLIFKTYNFPNFILFSIFIYMNIMFVSFIVVIIYHIPHILEIWVKETEDKK